jgi:hypothetical protein
MNIGGFNRQKYDDCVYQKKVHQSTNPLNYQLYEGKFENCNKCVFDKAYRPFDLVDVESELRNITRPLSSCDNLKYNPKCVKSKMCLSTFDKSAPVVLAQEVCPIVKNNIKRMTNPGYELQEADFCGRSGK